MQGERTAENIAEKSKDEIDEKQVYLYWMNCIKRAEKAQPTDEWKAAKDRLECKGENEDKKKPYVNGFRLHYETLKSFLDQTVAEFRITPTDAFVMDEIAIKQAECDLAYLTYVWNEQKCQIVSSQKLDSTIIRNIGVSLVGFDKRKWMPFTKYILAKNLLLDPDCDGIRANAKWEGFKEPTTIEELVSKNPNLTEDEITKIKKENTENLLTDEEQSKVDDELDNKQFSVITLYHIFARNDAAIRKVKEGEEQIPEKEVAQKLNLTTPKRYLQFIKGMEKPLRDEDDWPYELDDNEFPTTILRFNTPVENSYGFTDNIQMERLDTAFDNIMHDIEESAYWEGNKKFAGTPEAADLTDADIEKYLKDPKKYYLSKMIGSDGKPKIQQIDTGKFASDLVPALKLIDEQRDKASALGELLASEASHFKDVTAIGVRVHDANVHQKVNRRLSGPEAYEASICEDAVKMLEIAHQFVPRYSLLEVPTPIAGINEVGEFYETGETYMDYISLPWEQAVSALNQPGVSLIYLGVDAIVGPELAPYWRTADEYPPRLLKLSTKIRVLPGSTRTITKEHRAAVLKMYYREIFLPLYQAMNRWDLARNFIDHISNLIGLSESKDLIPDMSSVQQFMKEQEMLKQMQLQLQLQQGQQGQQSQTKEPKEGSE